MTMASMIRPWRVTHRWRPFSSIPWSDDEGLSNARLMLPDDANTVGNVHGGTILKMIEEAGFLVATRLCNRSRQCLSQPPMMGSLAQIFQMEFFLPMFVGELAKLYARPKFKPSGGIEVTVDVWAENVITGEIRHTNHASLCYSVLNADSGEQLLPRCLDEPLVSTGSASLPVRASDSDPGKPIPPDPTYADGKPSRLSAVSLVQVMHPSDCQRGNVVGGGAIMKLMDNAAAACAIKHCRTTAVTLSIDTLTFGSKVLLGDVAHVHARMVYTSARAMDVQVNVEIERLPTGEWRPSTSGNFTFVSLDTNKRPQGVPRLLPEGEQERAWYEVRAEKHAQRKLARGPALRGARS